MKSQQLKSYLKRYSHWRRQPLHYSYPSTKHRCSCCGEEHEGNYCPLCGQKASLGPVSWNSMWEGIMELWGLHSRSMPYTAWQLLFRPGHLMHDYVTGKRQVSFPPVKMLVLLGVIVYLLGHWLSPKDYSHELPEITTTGVLYYIEYAWKWVKVHNEWMTLIVFSFLILPTWLAFRYAPKLKRHTLPQGFFIQVFVANQSLVIELIFLLLSLIVLLVSNHNLNRAIFLVVLTAYLFIDYKQLFGYGWRGTLWRLIAMALLILVFFVDIAVIIAIFMSIDDGLTHSSTFSGVLMIGLVISWLTYISIYYVDVINRKLWRERGKWAVTKWPLITFAITMIVMIAIFTLLR